MKKSAHYSPELRDSEECLNEHWFSQYLGVRLLGAGQLTHPVQRNLPWLERFNYRYNPLVQPG